MNTKVVTYLTGNILRIEGLLMFPSLAVSLYCRETQAAKAFIASIIITELFGFLLVMKKPKNAAFYAREGFIIVALSWIAVSFFGSLPFYISREIPGFIDSFFETASGFTTTGSSILTNVEAMSKGLLLWRSFTHWVGGMGVLMFLLAILPQTKGAGHSLHIVKAESPGPAVGKMVPKVHQMAKILYIIYFCLTLAEIVFLLFGGMPLFDSVNCAFASAGTGGFSIKNSSIAFYDSAYIDTVVSVFILLFGVNFNIFYLMLIGDIKTALKDEELRSYIGIIVIATVIIALNILPIYENLLTAFRYSFFQVTSIMTTTGFATANFSLWPQLSKCLLVFLMFIGASAGSTGGGFKVIRGVIVMKQLKSELKRLIHPNSVILTKVNGKTIDSSVISGVNLYLGITILILIASVLLVALDNFSFETSFTAVMACMNNIGPGLDVVGPIGNFSAFSPLSKIVLTLDMLLGRLEIFPMIMLFSPFVWHKQG